MVSQAAGAGGGKQRRSVGIGDHVHHPAAGRHRADSSAKRGWPAMPSGVALISPSLVIGESNGAGARPVPNSTASLRASPRSRAWSRTVSNLEQAQRDQHGAGGAAVAEQGEWSRWRRSSGSSSGRPRRCRCWRRAARRRGRTADWRRRRRRRGPSAGRRAASASSFNGMVTLQPRQSGSARRPAMKAASSARVTWWRDNHRSCRALRARSGGSAASGCARPDRRSPRQRAAS